MAIPLTTKDAQDGSGGTTQASRFLRAPYAPHRRQLGTTRRGFVTLAVVSIGTAIVQVTHLATTSDPSWMTMLPLVIGTILVASMLLIRTNRERPPRLNAVVGPTRIRLA